MMAVAAGQAEAKARAAEAAKLSREQIDAERMARARSLAADPNYPTPEILATLSEMLARHWYS